MNLVIIIVVFFGGSFLIANFLGKERQIGFGWSFFFCLFLSPIIGFIITMLSRRYYSDTLATSQAKKLAGYILLVLFGLSLFGSITTLLIELNANIFEINAIVIAVGGIGLGYYLVKVGEGKSFSTKDKSEMDY